MLTWIVGTSTSEHCPTTDLDVCRPLAESCRDRQISKSAHRPKGETNATPKEMGEQEHHPTERGETVAPSKMEEEEKQHTPQRSRGRPHHPRGQLSTPPQKEGRQLHRPQGGGEGSTTPRRLRFLPLGWWCVLRHLCLLVGDAAFLILFFGGRCFFPLPFWVVVCGWCCLSPSLWMVLSFSLSWVVLPPPPLLGGTASPFFLFFRLFHHNQLIFFVFETEGI